MKRSQNNLHLEFFITKTPEKPDVSYPVQHGHDVLGVVEAADVFVMSAVHDGHSLQAQTFHLYFRSE